MILGPINQIVAFPISISFMPPNLNPKPPIPQPHHSLREHPLLKQAITANILRNVFTKHSNESKDDLLGVG